MRIGLMTDTFLPVVDGVGRVVVTYANTLSNLEGDGIRPLYDTGYRGYYPLNWSITKDSRCPPHPSIRQDRRVDSHYKKHGQWWADLVHSTAPLPPAGTLCGQTACIPLVSTFH